MLTSILAVNWLKSNVSAVAEIPQYSLNQFPKQIGDWTGEDVAIQDDTVEVLSTHSHINRLYRDINGRSIGLHIAIWTNEVMLAPTPHHPEVCYPSAGWQILSRRSITLPDTSDPLPLEFILFQKPDQSSVTGYWYQMGHSRYTHAGKLFTQRLKYFGAPSWPYSIKILLQTEAPNIETAQPMLEEFAKLVSHELELLSGSNSPAELVAVSQVALHTSAFK